ARRVGLAKPASVAAAAVLLAVPELYHIGASVNNDNLLILLLFGSTLAAATVARGDVRFRPAAVFGLVVGLALLPKGLALYLRFWLDPSTQDPPPVLTTIAVAASLVVVCGVLLSLVLRRPAWPDALLMLLPVICLLVMVAHSSWLVWSVAIRASGMQGRYMLG